MCHRRNVNLKMSAEINRSYDDNETTVLLQEIAKQENIHNYKILHADGSNKGDGYAGIIKSACIMGKGENDQDKVLHLITKSASKSDAMRTALPIASAFSREIYMYSVIFPTFQKLEMEKGQPASHFFPKYYKGQTIHKSELLILENLKEDGYQMFERRKTMDQNHVKLVISEYGRFHAISFALKDQNPKKYEEIAEPLVDLLVNFFKKTRFADNKCVKAQDALDENTDKEAIIAYKAFVSKLSDFFDELLEPNDEYSVILHGDCWANNMMFKYEDTHNVNKPTKVCFLDFQVSKVGSPVLDFVNFFYGCSSNDVIDNETYYMQLYYDSFSLYLRKLGSNPDKMFPYVVFEQHWKKFARYGLMLSAITTHVMFTEKDETIDFCEIAESGGSISNAFDYEISNIDQYNDRMRHIILHFVKNNLL